MAKRFSVREFGLLMAPVVAVGAVGFWASKRPNTPNVQAPHLSFKLETPTALQAFRGANVSCRVQIQNLSSFDAGTQQMSPYVELKTANGIEVGRRYGSYNRVWNRNLWNYSSSGPNFSRYLLKTGGVPAGEMSFGVFVVVPPNGGNVLPASPDFRNKPLRLSGKWKIARSQITAMQLTSWPRSPQVTLLEVKITKVYVSPNINVNGFHSISGECVFELEGVTSNDKTSFEESFSERPPLSPGSRTYGVSYGAGQSIKETPLTRVREWTANSDSLNAKINVSGRVSADNRWPLGFEIGSFSFKSAKVGQKLRFKQGPVALPKS